jgi:Asp-tRNA(Asn)/Glu-tRNA(Gln) amidotransferase A subunit family amidase
VDQIAAAEWTTGITLDPGQREAIRGALDKIQLDLRAIRSVPLSYDTLPAFRFDPELVDPENAQRCTRRPAHLKSLSADETRALAGPLQKQPVTPSADDLSFVPIRELARRMRCGELTSERLTEHCLQRLAEADPELNCVVTLTEDLARRQALQADRELASGVDRGLLHGIPWGAKDLIAVSGYATSWGAPQFRQQSLKPSAHVVDRLEAAGCVLVAKLSLGALAMGDRWFAGQTKNPWNPQQGSSGSSAGSASAVAAGLVPFALGSETLGSIISPSRRCGVAGLRPTFGRVSRFGCMPLSWTMDKIGPLARTVDDCALVLAAIHGADKRDPTSVDRWFDWPLAPDLSQVRVGRVTNAPIGKADQAALDALHAVGATFVDIELPRQFPEWALAAMLDVEAASVFEPLTLSGEADGLNAWPEIFQRSHFVSAVDWLHAARARTLLMREMADVFKSVHVYVGGNDLGISNLTGHPMLALPVLMDDVEPQSRPVCCTLTAGLHDEGTLLAIASLIERHVNVWRNRPRPAGV